MSTDAERVRRHLAWIAQQRSGELDPNEAGLDPGRRRQLRATARTMAGFRLIGASDLSPAPALVLQPGDIATRATLSDLAAAPELMVTPGESYSAAATTSTATEWVGLQWITQDGVPGDIMWAGGPGRVIAQGIAPPTAAGVRMLLAVYSPDLPLDPEAAAIMLSLAAVAAGGS